MDRVEVGSSAFFEVSNTGLWSAALVIVAVIVLERLAARFADDAYNGCKRLLKRAWKRFMGCRLAGKQVLAATAATIAPVVEPEASPLVAEDPSNDVIKTANGVYRDYQALAAGELAQLYLARWQPHQGAAQEVVLKVVCAPQDNDLMHNEIATLRGLWVDAGQYEKHLPRVLDQFRLQGERIGTVLERCQGFDLVALRQHFPAGVDARHGLWIFRRALSVLGYAHSRGVLHGNIQPDHIMVRPKDHNVWLLDWCYAIQRPRATGQGFRVVHPIYSAPEVAKRKPPLPAADLYSLGLCMVYLLGGDPQQHSLPDRVPAVLQRFIRFFLRESAIQRPQDAWEMYRKLEQIRDQLYGPHRFVEFILPPRKGRGVNL